MAYRVNAISNNAKSPFKKYHLAPVIFAALSMSAKSCSLSKSTCDFNLKAYFGFSLCFDISTLSKSSFPCGTDS